MYKDKNTVWKNVSFQTKSYRKNFDLIINGDNIITEYAGIISLLRLDEMKPPIFIGEYNFSTWNISVAKLLNININDLISSHKQEDTYVEYLNLNDKMFEKYNKIVFIHNLIIHPEYRKIGISEEFVEYLFRDFHSDDTIILALVKPIQDNTINFDSYFTKKFNTETVNDDDSGYNTVAAVDYYSLDKLTDKDNESSKYRLFSVAVKCGFQRIKESNLFKFNPEIMIERMKKKYC
jgi:hypothetical protein